MKQNSTVMTRYEDDVRKIKKELARRLTLGKQKSISSQKLQQFLMDWFKYPKRSSLSEEDQENIKEIQTLFDQNNIAGKQFDPEISSPIPIYCCCKIGSWEKLPSKFKKKFQNLKMAFM
jgi:hypothetical protein